MPNQYTKELAQKNFNIEAYFLTLLLRIGIGGISFITVIDFIFFAEDRLSLILDIIVFFACVFSYLIRKKSADASVILVCTILLGAMYYQSLSVPINTNTSLTIILMVGFVFSIMLKKWMLNAAQVLTISVVFLIFIGQYLNPELRFTELNDTITVFITYFVLYFIVTFATAKLKNQYDTIFVDLKLLNEELELKSENIKSQNEELLQIQETLHSMNQNLESVVEERTEKLRIRTEKIIKYGFNNAHHLRGPVARLLGLIYIRKLDDNPDDNFYFKSIEEQTIEIDNVVKHINDELGNNDLSEADYLLSENPNYLKM